MNESTQGGRQMHADPEVDPEEIMQAAAEPVGQVDTPPEVVTGTEDLTEWDTPPGASGKTAPETELEDEVSPSERLVNDGLEQADRDLRIAAADPDQES
jgi:hypothetical protein